MKAKRRAPWIVFGLATIAWGHAAGRLWIANERPSSARSVAFRTADGTRVPETSINCHQTAIVVGDTVFQGCHNADDKGSWLARFELRHGRATLYPIQDGSLFAAALHPDGRLAIATYDGLYLVRGGDVTPLPRSTDGVIMAMAWRGEALEVVHYQRVATYRGGQGPPAWRRVPYPDHDVTRDDVQFETAYPTPEGWRFLYARMARTVPPEGPIPVDVIELREGQAARTLGTLQLAAPYAHRLDDDPTKAWARDILDPTPAGKFSDEHDRYQVDGDRLIAPVPPPPGIETEYGFARDYELVPGALTAIPRQRIRDNVVRVRGRWIAHDHEREARLHDLVTGKSGPPITSVFWLDPGFKLLPATDGGMWVMGSLGEAYLHVDASLARTDHLSFGERLDRLTVFDRAKRNSDFDLTWTRRIAVPATLLGFLILVLPVALVALVGGIARRERFAGRARIALVAVSVGYIVVRLALWSAYADLTGTFWA